MIHPSAVQVAADSSVVDVAHSASGGGGNRPERCKNNCRWPYSQANGYPTTAFHGALSDYLCPSMFRDLSDWVFKWPFSHFKEKVKTADQDVAAACLPPVPIVYVHASSYAGVAQW